jgi:aminoglycoside phosphotransferase (APT) family kinase protein
MDPRMRRDDIDFLGDAFDPARVAALVAAHLRSPDDPPIDVTKCELTFARRGGARQLFQYRIHLRDRQSGDERRELVTALAYAGRDTEQLWTMLRPRLPTRNGASALAPAAYVTDHDILLQTFPFDYRLVALAPLIAGRLPGLPEAVAHRFGPGDWRITEWDAASVRYRVDLRATVRVAMRARSLETGETADRRFYAKVYAAPESASGAYEAQRRLAEAAAAVDSTLGFAPLVAYLPEARLLVQDEVSGESLEDLMADDDRAIAAIRATGRALASLHRLAVTAPDRPQMDRVAQERLDICLARLEAARPDLGPAAAKVATGIADALAKIGEPLAVPVHGDLKPAHILFQEGRVVLLDVDKLSAGEPMRDVADLLIRFGRGVAGKREGRLARLRSPLVGAYLAEAPAAWAKRLPPHYAAALLREAAASSESARSGADDGRAGRKAKQARYPGLLLEQAQAVLAGDDSGWGR